MSVNEKKNITACFTGHRKILSNEISTVKKRLVETISSSIEKGYCYFGAGGALGFDTLAAQVVLELKEKYPDIKLILVLPCPNQTRGWSEADVAEYERIKTEADKVVYTSDHYFRGCMQKRNRHLVDNSSLCICYLTESSGGTAYTVDYAVQNDLVVMNVAE